MRIGAGLLLIAVGAIPRFGIAIVSTHGVATHTIGDILMLVGVLGVRAGGLHPRVVSLRGLQARPRPASRLTGRAR